MDAVVRATIDFAATIEWRVGHGGGKARFNHRPGQHSRAGVQCGIHRRLKRQSQSRHRHRKDPERDQDLEESEGFSFHPIESRR